MIRVTAYPTVEWLNTRTTVDLVDDRFSGNGIEIALSMRSAASSGLAWTNATGLLARYATLRRDVSSRLDRWSSEQTEIKKSVWITTPNGEEFVDMIVEYRGRRIAYRFYSRSERELEQSDAITLVYGKFDALYRVRLLEHGVDDADLAFLVVSMNPSWFSSDGRLRAGRVASNMALHAVQRLKRIGTATLPGFSVNRIRISRVGEWVREFEQALSLPDFRTYVASRLPRNSNRPSLKITRHPVSRGSVQK